MQRLDCVEFMRQVLEKLGDLAGLCRDAPASG